MNITLIGMPGVGKSTLGVLLAKALGMGFIDTDILIQQQEGQTLQAIIESGNVDSFIKIEEKVICHLNADNVVIATGGSAVYSDKAMNALKKQSIIIYLALPYDTINKRITNITSRGILIRPGKSLLDIYNERIPLYEEYCDHTIDCSNKDIEQCLNEIVCTIKT